METQSATDPNTSPPWGDTAAEATVGKATDSSEATIEEVDQILDAVEAALTRLDDGSYRLCRVCGASMDDARLADDPTASVCTGCEVSGSVDEVPVPPGYAAPSPTA
jgi:RNA polymerase-binding transcription factor DksA